MRFPLVNTPGQTLHASGLAALLLAACCGSAVAGPPDALNFSGSLGFGYDGNPANAESGNTVTGTGYAAANLAASLTQRPGDSTAILLRGSLDGQQYFNYVGLSSAKATLLLRGLYRPQLGFLSPTFAAWGSAAALQFGASMRNSGEYRGGLYAAEQLTTTLNLRLGGYYVERRSASGVFDTDGRAATLDADWLLGQRLTGYLGYEFRYGGFDTSSPPDPGAAAGATASASDDAIVRDGVRDIVYRLQGHAQSGTLGMNYALTPSLALDAQAQGIRTRVSTGDHYTRMMSTLSLLARF
jgi:hypothetical protein